MKGKILLNKPIAVGFMVLENSKYLMVSFWDTVLLKAKYGSAIKPLLSDTDSFIHGVYTNDCYKSTKSCIIF